MPERSSGGEPRLGAGVQIGEVVARVVLVVVAATLLPKVFPADIGHYRNLADCMTSPTAAQVAACEHKGFVLGHLGAGFNAPYRSVLFEFPPLGLLTLLLIPLSFGSLVVNRLLFGWVMAALELLALRALRKAWPEHAVALTRVWSLTVLPIALITWFRLDFMAVLFATLALVAVEQRRRATGWVVLGWLSKLWPVVVVAALVVRRRFREVVEAAVAVAVVTLAWWAWSPEGFSEFLDYRAGHGLEIESLFASFRLLGHHGRAELVSGAYVIDAGGFLWVNTAAVALLAAFAIAALVRAWRPGADLAALCGALTLASMLFSRILSAQYVAWLAPFVALVAVRGRSSVAWSYGVASGLTFAYLCVFDRYLVKGNRLAGALVLGRNVALVVLLVFLFAAIRPPDEQRAT